MKKIFKNTFLLIAISVLFVLVAKKPLQAFSDAYVTSQTVTESYTYQVWIDCKWVHYTDLYTCKRCPGSGSSCRPHCTYEADKARVLNPAGTGNPNEIQNCNSTQCNGNHTKYADVYQNTCNSGTFWCDNGPRPPTLDHWETRTGYRNVTYYTCHYISAVNSWTPCSDEGVQVATDVTWSSVNGTSCSNVPLARSCTPTPRHNLNATVAGSGSGWVDGSGINCGQGRTPCTISIREATPFSLTAHENSDSRFTGWSGCPSPSGTSCSGTMRGADINVVANFTLKPNLKVTINGCGTINAPPLGWSCSSSGGSKTCPDMRVYNTNVPLTTSACPNSHFGSWGGACNGSSGCNVRMGSTDQSVIAFFASEGNCSCDTNDCKSTCIGESCDDSCGNPTCKGTLSCPLWQEVQP